MARASQPMVMARASALQLGEVAVGSTVVRPQRDHNSSGPAEDEGAAVVFVGAKTDGEPRAWVPVEPGARQVHGYCSTLTSGDVERRGQVSVFVDAQEKPPPRLPPGRRATGCCPHAVHHLSSASRATGAPHGAESRAGQRYWYAMTAMTRMNTTASAQPRMWSRGVTVMACYYS